MQILYFLKKSCLLKKIGTFFFILSYLFVYGLAPVSAQERGRAYDLSAALNGRSAEGGSSPFGSNYTAPIASLIQGARTSSDLFASARTMVVNEGVRMVTDPISVWANQFGLANVRLNLDNHFHIMNSGLDLLVPVYDVGNNLTFIQGSLDYDSKRGGMNIGVGNRYLLGDALVGINGFFDYNFSGKHSRLGLGGEYWRDYLRVGLNSYFGLNSYKDNDFKISKLVYTEKPAHGFDLYAQAFVPSLPQLGFDLGFEQYFGSEIALLDAEKRQKNPHIFNIGVNYTPIPLVDLKLDYKNDSRASAVNFGVGVTYRFGVPFEVQTDTNAVADLRRLQGSRYELVKRNNNIILDYKKKDDIEITLFDERFVTQNQSVKAFQSVSIGPDWEVEKWTTIPANQNAMLSSECNKATALSSCKITAPPYQSRMLRAPGDAVKNRYAFTLHLKNKKTQETRDVGPTVIKVREEDPINILPTSENVTATEGSRVALFSSVSVPSGWTVSWDPNTANFDLSGCNNEATLKTCKVTMPAYKEGGNNTYKLGLVLSKAGKESYRAPVITFNVTKAPVTPSVTLKNPIEGQEGTRVKIFSAADNAPGWTLTWTQETTVPAANRPNCDVADLIACEIVLPAYDSSRAPNQYVLQGKLTKASQTDIVVGPSTVNVTQAAGPSISVNAAITGQERTEHPVFASAANATGWTLTWDNKSPKLTMVGCDDMTKLTDCKVRLPDYDPASGGINQYTLKGKLTKHARATTVSLQEITVTVERPPSPVVDVATTAITAEGGTAKKIFTNVGNLDNWQINWKNFPTKVTKTNCDDVKDLANCTITVPNYDASDNANNVYQISGELTRTGYTAVPIGPITITATAPAAGDEDEPVVTVNKSISGQAGEKKLIFSAAETALGWSLSWDNPGGLEITDCNDMEHLTRCKVTIPAYLSGRGINDYTLKGTLTQGSQTVSIDPITVTSEAPSLPEITLPNPVISLAGGSTFSPLNVVSMLPGWKAEWELDVGAFSLNAACRDATNLGKCEVTLPEYNQSGKNTYSLKLVLKHILGIIPDLTVGPISVTVTAGNPDMPVVTANKSIKGHEGDKKSIFRAAESALGWTLTWENPNSLEITDCDDMGRLTRCKVTIPAYLSGRGINDHTLKGTLTKGSKTVDTGTITVTSEETPPAETPEVTLPNLAISLAEGSTFNPLNVVSMLPGWSVEWELDVDHFSLSAACRNTINLGQCEVTLPKYNPSGKNTYSLKIVLKSPLGILPDISLGPISVTVKASSASKPKVTANTSIVGHEGDKKPIFSAADKASGWTLTWNNPDSLAITDCDNMDRLTDCKVTIPPYLKSRGSNDHTLRGTLTKGSQTIDTGTITVTSKDSLLPNLPVVTVPNLAVSLASGSTFSPVSLVSMLPGWKVEWDIQAGKFALSGDCHNATSLAECKVTVPKYDPSGDNTYSIKIILKNILGILPDITLGPISVTVTAGKK